MFKEKEMPIKRDKTPWSTYDMMVQVARCYMAIKGTWGIKNPSFFSAKSGIAYLQESHPLHPWKASSLLPFFLRTQAALQRLWDTARRKDPPQTRSSNRYFWGDTHDCIQLIWIQSIFLVFA
jgi:hypothetical protein